MEFRAHAILVTGLLVATLSAGAPAQAGCPPTPWAQESCGAFGRTSLAIDSYGHVEWRGSHGPATDAGFIDPSAAYLMCIWDEEKLVVAADVPADAECPGGSCWTEPEAAVREYKDEAGANGDIHAMRFTASDGPHTSLRVSTLVVGGINLPVIGGVITQLVRTDDQSCFESFIPADSFTIDDRAAFAAKFDIDDAE